MDPRQQIEIGVLLRDCQELMRQIRHGEEKTVESSEELHAVDQNLCELLDELSAYDRDI